MHTKEKAGVCDICSKVFFSKRLSEETSFKIQIEGSVFHNSGLCSKDFIKICDLEEYSCSFMKVWELHAIKMPQGTDSEL